MHVGHRPSDISASYSYLPATFTIDNVGGLSDTSDWQQQVVPLPAMREKGDTVSIKAEFNPAAGGFALDNVKIATRDTCVQK